MKRARFKGVNLRQADRAWFIRPETRMEFLRRAIFNSFRSRTWTCNQHNPVLPERCFKERPFSGSCKLADPNGHARSRACAGREVAIATVQADRYLGAGSIDRCILSETMVRMNAAIYHTVSPD